MKALREWLSVVLWPLQVVFGLLYTLLNSAVPWVLSRTFYLLRNLIRDHFLLPVIVARRVIAGQPRWKPHDVMFGWQPRTDEQRAVAAADEHLVAELCLCSNPNCKAKTSPRYQYFADASKARAIRESAHVAIDPSATEEIDFLKHLTKVQEQTIDAYQNADETSQVLVRELDAQVERLRTRNEQLEAQQRDLEARAADAEKRLSDVRDSYRN